MSCHARRLGTSVLVAAAVSVAVWIFLQDPADDGGRGAPATLDPAPATTPTPTADPETRATETSSTELATTDAAADPAEATDALDVITHTVSGRVVDPDGEPVAGATVTTTSGFPFDRAMNMATSGDFTVRPADRETMLRQFQARTSKTISDDTGHFRLEDVQPGRRRVKVTHDDFARARSDRFEVESDVTNLEIVMERAFVLRGRVVDADGAGIAGVKVRSTEQQDGFTGMMSAGPMGPKQNRTETDSDGRFELRGQRAGGLFNLSLSHGEYLKHRIRDLDAGGEPVLDLGEIPFDDGSVITGVVRDARTSEPVAGARVALIDENSRQPQLPGLMGMGRRRVRSGDDGSYQLGPVEAGHVRVRVEADGYSPFESKRLTLGDSVELAHDVFLEAGSVITGVVRDASGAPLPKARVRAYRTGDGDARRIDSARTDAAGRFELADLPAGEYELRVRQRGHMRTSITTRVSGAMDVGEIVLHAGSTLTGRVFDDAQDPVNRGVVRIEPADGGKPFRALVQGGRFKKSGLPPGEYSVSVASLADMFRRRVVDGDESVAPATSPPIDVTIGPGDNVELDLTVPKRGS